MEGEKAPHASHPISLPIVMSSRCCLFALLCGPSAIGTALLLPAHWSANKTAPRPGLHGAPQLSAPLWVVIGGKDLFWFPTRAHCSASLSGMGAFTQQRIIDLFENAKIDDILSFLRETELYQKIWQLKTG